MARWSGEPWRSLGVEVIKGLLQGTVEGTRIPLFDGRLDLRGINLPKPAHLKLHALTPPKRNYPLGEAASFQDKPLEVRRVLLADVDLSHSNIAYTRWYDCRFRNVLFSKAQVHNVRFSTCAFEDVNLEGANLKETGIGGLAGSRPSNYRRTSFARADLRYTDYGYSLFEDCDFSHAKFAKVDFRGSQFVRCKFAGRMGETWFHGWYALPDPADEEYFARSGIDSKTIRNQMLDVDFSAAELWTVQFVDDIDLSRCRFPTDGNHLVVRDRARVLERARTVVGTEWQGQEREEALDLLDLFFGTQDRALKSWEEYYRKRKSPKEVAEILEGARKRVWRGNAWKMNAFHRRLFEGSSGGVHLFNLLLQVAGE